MHRSLQDKHSRSLFLSLLQQVVSQKYRENPIAEVGWKVVFGVADRARFPYWFYFPSLRKQQVANFMKVVSSWDYERVITGHLDIISETEDAGDIFRGSFDYIVKS